MNLVELISSQSGIPLWLIAIVLAWSLAWKSVALWKSARSNHLVWFVAFIVFQTMGILEILYIFLFSKIKLQQVKRRKR